MTLRSSSCQIAFLLVRPGFSQSYEVLFLWNVQHVSLAHETGWETDNTERFRAVESVFQDAVKLLTRNPSSAVAFEDLVSVVSIILYDLIDIGLSKSLLCYLIDLKPPCSGTVGHE